MAMQILILHADGSQELISQEAPNTGEAEPEESNGA